MPITKSAKKALRQSKKRRTKNLRQLRAMRDIIKNIQKFVLGNKKDEARGNCQNQGKKAFDKIGSKS